MRVWEGGRVGCDCRVSVGLGVHFRLLPSDLSGPKDQLPLEGREDPGAQGSREHQQCQEHPVSVSRREASGGDVGGGGGNPT